MTRTLDRIISYPYNTDSIGTGRVHKTELLKHLKRKNCSIK